MGAIFTIKRQKGAILQYKRDPINEWISVKDPQVGDLIIMPSPLADKFFCNNDLNRYGTTHRVTMNNHPGNGTRIVKWLDFDVEPESGWITCNICKGKGTLYEGCLAWFRSCLGCCGEICIYCEGTGVCAQAFANCKKCHGDPNFRELSEEMSTSNVTAAIMSLVNLGQ